MSITFYPKPGTLLVCDFTTGFREPEMVKVRNVVVVSRPQDSKVCTVVPLSTTPPDPVEKWHHKIAQKSLPEEKRGLELWAKCDMVVTVGHLRLDRIRVNRGGKWTYVVHAVCPEDLLAIKTCLLHVFGNADLIPPKT